MPCSRVHAVNVASRSGSPPLRLAAESRPPERVAASPATGRRDIAAPAPLRRLAMPRTMARRDPRHVRGQAVDAWHRSATRVPVTARLLVHDDSNASAHRDAASPPPTAEGEDRRALDALFSLAYEELRRLAATLRRHEPSATIQTTTLVNEAWLKLAGSRSLGATDEQHFKRIAVRAMRQVLVDAARRRRANKREGVAVELDHDVLVSEQRSEWLLALDEALARLAQVSPRKAQMVEARFFGGFDVLETARLLDVSEATVMRDWRLARAWLASELHGGELPL